MQKNLKKNIDSVCVCFPGSSMIKNLLANTRYVGSIPGWERSPGGGGGNPLQHFCLGNPQDRGAWQATVHMVEKLNTTG